MFKVIWEIDLDADSPVEAARLALAIQRDPYSIATHFEVFSEDGVQTIVDIEAEDEV